MTKVLVLRCGDEAIHIAGKPELMDYLVHWITMHDYQTQRYPENEMDIFEFENYNYFEACNDKATKLGLLQVTKKS